MTATISPGSVPPDNRAETAEGCVKLPNDKLTGLKWKEPGGETEVQEKLCS